MRAIGFSTGALAKGDFAAGIELQRRVGRINAIELSALREHELRTLVNRSRLLDLRGFSYISFHAPSKLKEMSETEVFDLLEQLPEEWPIIAHPEILQTPSLWRRLGERLCLENMDNRKTTGRTVEELLQLFSSFPDAGFCLDVGHARQIDPTMTSAILMLRHFGGRLRQLHVSEVGSRGEHLRLGATSRYAMERVARHIPDHCPLVIESVTPANAILDELHAVITTFDGVNLRAAIA